MAAVVDTDWSVDTAGNIRYTGSGTTNTVLELHRWLQLKADDAAAAGDDIVDIVTETPSSRSTDNIIDLINGYNIDDYSSQFLFNGSITQDGGDTVYSGLTVVGSVESGTKLQVIQDARVLPDFWDTGLNADAANNIIMRILVKTRADGVDIDGKRVRVRAAEFGDAYSDFSVTLGLGNSTAAIFTSPDLNNTTNSATVYGWTDVLNTEGLRLIDVNNDTVNEEYYSQWDFGTRTVNQFYERTKIIGRRGVAEDSNAETGNDFPCGNGTITRQGQSFQVGSNDTKLVRARFRLKANGSPTGDVTATLYAHSGTFGTSSVGTGSALATSTAYDASTLTTTYREVEFVFDELDGADYTMLTATQYYVVAVEHTGDASNYVVVDGDTTGTHAGNQADFAGTWTAAAAEDLWFEVDASMPIHDMPGELFRGPTHQVPYDTEAGGPFTEDEEIVWGVKFNYDNEASGPFLVGDRLIFAGTDKGTLIYLNDAGTTGTMVVAMDTEYTVPSDNDAITTVAGDSGATADVNGTPTGAVGVYGQGRLLALDDDGSTGNLYIQRRRGVAPVNNTVLTGATSGATAAVNGTPTARTTNPEFVGQSTGSALIGAYGIGVNTDDLTASDKLFDLTNTQITPPNNVTFTVNGVVSGEDRILVGPEDGASGLDRDQLALLTTRNNLTATITATASIPTDTPSSGDVRVQLDSGIYRECAYSSYAGAAFSLTSALDFSSDPATTATTKNVFIGYIDKLAASTSENVTVVYNADRTLFIRVRDGGGTPIKTFETTGSLTNTGGSVTVIRTSDA